MLVPSFLKCCRPLVKKPTQANRCSSDGHTASTYVSATLFKHVKQEQRVMEKPWGKWRHSFQQWRQTFGDREEIHVYMHTVLYKASTSEIPSLSVLMKGMDPAWLLMGHTSWKCSDNSFCKKRKLNSKWAFSLPICQVTIQCTVHERCSDCWTATVMRDISSERRVRGWAPLLSGKENKAALGIVNGSLIFSNPFLQAVILQ